MTLNWSAYIETIKLDLLHFSDRSSVSLSDLPINPPPPDMDSKCAKFNENGPLSEPPSPFLSKDIYLQCHREALEQVIFQI